MPHTYLLTDDTGRKWRRGARPEDSVITHPFQGDDVGKVDDHGHIYVLMKRGDVYFLRPMHSDSPYGHRVFLERNE